MKENTPTWQTSGSLSGSPVSLAPAKVPSLRSLSNASRLTDIRLKLWMAISYALTSAKASALAARIAIPISNASLSSATSSPATASICISAAIAPYREAREWAREHIGNFVEIYVKCPLDVCRARDVKGLYKLVDEGKIKNFTGVDDPYEEPEHPELVVETDKETVEESISRIFAKLEELGYLTRADYSATDG